MTSKKKIVMTQNTGKSEKKSADAPRAKGGAVRAVIGSEADYQALVPIAARVEPHQVLPFRADANLAYHNAKIGVASLLAVEDRVKRLPETDLGAIVQLPAIASALCFSITQIAQPPPAAKDTKPLLARAQRVRRKLLDSAVALATAGHFPKAIIDEIRRGTGSIDSATDCVQLAALYGKHWAVVRDKTPVTAEDLNEAADVGSRLMGVLKPQGAPRRSNDATESSAARAEAMQRRDRLWTLLVRGHEAMRRAGVYLFGEDAVDARVPALQSRTDEGRPPRGGDGVVTAW
jgi:hypothetical protein